MQCGQRNVRTLFSQKQKKKTDVELQDYKLNITVLQRDKMD